MCLCHKSISVSSKFTKIICGWGFSPDPIKRVYSTPTDPLISFGKGNRFAVQERGGEDFAPATIRRPHRRQYAA